MGAESQNEIIGEKIIGEGNTAPSLINSKNFQNGILVSLNSGWCSHTGCASLVQVQSYTHVPIQKPA